MTVALADPGFGFVGEAGSLILTGTEVVAEVRADLALVEVHQTFENPFAVPMDATYHFPLPVGAAVREMVMTCGDRVIRGEIQSKEDARKTYEEALAAGKRAGLLEQQRANVFTQRVGGICPGETVEVTLQYVEDVEVSDGTHTFTFPTTTGHRYDPNGLREAPLVPSSTPGRSLTLDLVVHTGTPIESIWSDTYTIDVLSESTEGARIGLAQPALPNSDVQVSWKMALQEPTLTTLTARDARGEAYLGLTLHPPVPETAPTPRQRELIFVLDASCSMQGQPWETATETVRMAMEALRPGERFNLVRFSDAASSAFPEPVEVDPQSLRSAEQWLVEHRAGGGTDMQEGVRKALEMPGDPEALRLVMLLTDGYIGSEQAFFKTVKASMGANDRIFGLGIGSSVNRLLIDGLAHHGRGVALYQLPGTPIEETLKTLYRRIDHPVLTDIEIDWGDLQVVQAGPTPDLFVGQPLQVVGRVGDARRSLVTVRGLLAGEPWQTEIEVDLDRAELHESVPVLWARKRIQDWAYDLEADGVQQQEAITALAVQHHLVSGFTSLVAVDTKPAGCGDGSVEAAVPALAPAGVSGGMGGLGTRGSGTGGGGGSAIGYGKGGGSFGRTAGGTVAGSAPIILGSLDRSAVQRVIRRSTNQIRYCYQRELAKRPALGGKLVIAFEVTGDGRVSKAEVGAGSTLSNAAVERCVIGRFQRMKFPSVSGGGTIKVRYPFVFRSGAK